MKKAKAVAALILCLITVFMCLPVHADEGAVSLSVISANVSGLPAFLSKYDRVVPEAQKTLGGMLNKSGYDIVCVQEDFQYHKELCAEMTSYPYKTYTSGGVPIGDGLNIFSKYPMYNIDRVAWESFNGVFSDGADALTPKGFLKCTVDVGGVLIDLYNIHGDAYSTDADQLAKKAQLEQLSAYIEAHSAGRPIIITGDTNLTFHKDPKSEFYRIMIEDGGFTDCWVEVKNNGNYMQGADGSGLIANWYKKFGGHDWGRWDSVERVLYRNGDGIEFSPSRFEYVIYTDRDDVIKSLTDHRIMECVLEINTKNYQKPDIALESAEQPSGFYSFFHGAAMLLRFLFIVIAHIVKNNIAATAAVLAAAVILVILIKKRRRKHKKAKQANVNNIIM